MNESIYVLILKRVVMNLHIYFPSQQEIRRSTLEGIKGIRRLRLLRTGILLSDQKCGVRNS